MAAPWQNSGKIVDQIYFEEVFGIGRRYLYFISNGEIWNRQLDVGRLPEIVSRLYKLQCPQDITEAKAIYRDIHGKDFVPIHDTVSK